MGRTRKYQESDARNFELMNSLIDGCASTEEALKRLRAKRYKNKEGVEIDNHLASMPWSLFFLQDMVESDAYREWKRDYLAMKADQAEIAAFRALSDPEAFGKEVSASVRLQIAGGKMANAVKAMDRKHEDVMPKRRKPAEEGDMEDLGTAAVLFGGEKK